MSHSVPRLARYEDIYSAFRWNIPARYNIAADVCDRHAEDSSKVALIIEGADGRTWKMTFREVQQRANRLANLSVALGLNKGDRVMLLMAQDAWAAIGHVADWLITGDLGTRDEDGYFWFKGRVDDVITSSGYRIGPAEIEDALTRHPAVVLAAAVGVPDPVRTESIKAFVVLRKGHAPGPELASEIRDFLRSRLARHEVPRDIDFVESLPMTTTGKISAGSCAPPSWRARRPSRTESGMAPGSKVEAILTRERNRIVEEFAANASEDRVMFAAIH